VADSLASLFVMITVYTTFLPITTGQVLRLDNADILLSSLGTSTTLQASLLLCEHCVNLCVKSVSLFFYVCDCVRCVCW